MIESSARLTPGRDRLLVRQLRDITGVIEEAGNEGEEDWGTLLQGKAAACRKRAQVMSLDCWSRTSWTRTDKAADTPDHSRGGNSTRIVWRATPWTGGSNSSNPPTHTTGTPGTSHTGCR